MDRKKIDEDLAIIFDGIDDATKIEALGRLKGELDSAAKETEDMANKATEYARKWKESILKGGFNDPAPAPNPVPIEEPKSFLDSLKAFKAKEEEQN